MSERIKCKSCNAESYNDPGKTSLYCENCVSALRAENERLKSSQACEVCQNPIAARSHAEIIERLRNENERLRASLIGIRAVNNGMLEDMTDEPRDEKFLLIEINAEIDDALKGGEE